MNIKKYKYIIFLFFLIGILLISLIPQADLKKDSVPSVPADVAWMLVSSGLVLLMTPGLAFFYGGMVKTKNVISTMLQSFVAMGLVSLIWWAFGFSLAFGESFHGFIGNPFTYFMFHNVGESTHKDISPTIPLALFAIFQLKFAIITPALATGAFAERVKFSAYVLFLALFSVIIYAPLAHWTWHPEGFLRQWGVLDFAGGTVVHMSAGFAALAGAIRVGKRRGFDKVHSAPNIQYVLLGTGLLWVGWFGFNSGSALAANGSAVMTLICTHFAAASAMVTWMFFDFIRGRKLSALGASVGAVVGLVAITPGSGYVSPGAGIFIGSMAAILSNLSVSIKHKFDVDDTLDVFACHGVSAIFGMISTAIFAKDVGLIYGNTNTLKMHLIALVIVSFFCFFGAQIIYRIVDKIISLRVSEECEEIGLDLSQHDEVFGFNNKSENPERTNSD